MAARPQPYTPPVDTPEQEMKTLCSALRTYYNALADEHNALTQMRCAAPMEVDRSRIEFLRQERARCTRIMERVFEEYLAMLEEAKR